MATLGLFATLKMNFAYDACLVFIFSIYIILLKTFNKKKRQLSPFQMRPTAIKCATELKWATIILHNTALKSHKSEYMWHTFFVFAKNGAVTENLFFFSKNDNISQISAV